MDKQEFKKKEVLSLEERMALIKHSLFTEGLSSLGIFAVLFLFYILIFVVGVSESSMTMQIVIHTLLWVFMSPFIFVGFYFFLRGFILGKDLTKNKEGISLKGKPGKVKIYTSRDRYSKNLTINYIRFNLQGKRIMMKVKLGEPILLINHKATKQFSDFLLKQEISLVYYEKSKLADYYSSNVNELADKYYVLNK